MTPEQLAEIEKRYEKAEAVVADLVQGRRKWTMSIPARPDSDPDLVIGRALRDIPDLVRALREAWKERDEAGALRRFPIMHWAERGPCPTSIPWHIADLAYSEYRKRYGSDQSLEALAQRGGFHADEMDDFLPDWRQRAADATTTTKRAEAAERKLAVATSALRRVQAWAARPEMYGGPTRLEVVDDALAIIETEGRE